MPSEAGSIVRCAWRLRWLRVLVPVLALAVPIAGVVILQPRALHAWPQLRLDTRTGICGAWLLAAAAYAVVAAVRHHRDALRIRRREAVGATVSRWDRSPHVMLYLNGHLDLAHRGRLRVLAVETLLLVAPATWVCMSAFGVPAGVVMGLALAALVAWVGWLELMGEYASVWMRARERRVAARRVGLAHLPANAALSPVGDVLLHRAGVVPGSPAYEVALRLAQHSGESTMLPSLAATALAIACGPGGD